MTQTPCRIAIIGEYNADFPPHRAVDDSIEHVQRALRAEVETTWIRTDRLIEQGEGALDVFDGIWSAPGSPFASMEGALLAIRFARENGVPLLATCGGCQHVVIEYARNVLGIPGAQHAEYAPDAEQLFITPLSCSLVGKRLDVEIVPGSAISALYGGATRVAEQYYCNFGVNPAVEETLERGGLGIVGRDVDGESRILTLEDHPFFVATVFVPSLTSTPERPHPLVKGFIHAAAVRSRTDQPRLEKTSHR